MTDSPTILVIDNYDSFVYILVQYLGELGASPVVRRHDEIDLDGIRALDPDGMLISPGPGNPDDSGVSMDILTNLTTDTPIFGVCLGMQCMGQAFGGEVVRAPQVMHGKTSMIRHRDVGVWVEVHVAHAVRVAKHRDLGVVADDHDRCCRQSGGATQFLRCWSVLGRFPGSGDCTVGGTGRSHDCVAG